MAAEVPSPPPEEPAQYWCHHCEKRVRVETQPDDVICTDCKFGFVESISTTTTTTSTTNDAAAAAATLSPEHMDEPNIGSQFLQVLRLLAQVARDDDAPPPPPPPPPPPDPSPSDESQSDFLRIEIDGWDEDNENNDDDDDIRSVEIEGHSDDEDSDEEEDREEDIHRRRRDVLRLRLRDFASQARSEGRNRILDWAEILMSLEDNSIEFRFDNTDSYIGNPGDYVNATEYEALLQNLADAEGGRGAPPAAKSAMEALKIVERVDESFVCAICKDGDVCVGDVVKEMPCGHYYHGDCILHWLESRNSCPVCRFELPTDDAEYEEERKKKTSPVGSSSSSGTLL